MRGERSDRTVYLRVLGPLALATLTLVVVSVGGFHALSATRAYVGGESLWSKARSQAISFLRENPTDCSRFDSMLEVPLGDKDARVALDASTPNLDAAARGFIRGGNAPADIDGMIHLYLNFHSLPPVQEAIDAWKIGDSKIEQLRALAPRICAQVRAGPGIEHMAPLLSELDRIEDELIEAELRFSRALGRASRVTETGLTLITLLLALGLAGGGAWYVVVSLRGRFAQQQALQEVNNRWELAAEAAKLGLFVWHPQDDVIELDQRARLIYGLDPNANEPVTRDTLRALIHPDDRDRTRTQTDAARSGGSAPLLRMRYRLQRPSGEVRHLEVIGVLREDIDGEAPQMFGMLRDVTDEVTRASFQLEKEAAERSARARSEFLSRLSHELRTPLNAILGLAQVVEMDPAEPLQPRQAQRIRMMVESGWHLLHLVDDVLDITSIDSGALSVNNEPTDLASSVEASLAMIEPQRQQFDITVRNTVPHGLEPVLADPRRLQQVLANLFSNGCKYNKRGGTLTISVRDQGHRVCLDIDDQGAGLRSDEIAELFQPFKRLAKTGDVEGTGLGLTVVKMLVEQMSGTVEVTSEPGRGSRFTVCLPRVQALAG